ncbi:RecF/RecN/SMC protein [Ancylostoma ceylanicum]|uniref:RecF/RecN/SMC protein n=1 Tax=Ancylostoma ceylanicum TaxID=53326 RepID=A0A0D6LG22_9BILA|nr:RecF/RecN/SMC protein [Ancylostoma ceylanicum]
MARKKVVDSSDDDSDFNSDEEKKKKKTAKKRLPSPSKTPPAPKRKQAKLATPARGGAASKKGQEQKDGGSSSEEENEFVENYENEDLLRMNFTAIIGPNGSGKSNVIDSLLFVFGYKASKIRSKKLSVLIHSSRGHDDINSCTVEVFFEQIVDKDGHFEVVEGSEFSVARTAYKNNNSVYAWNGKTMSIKEIAGRLRGFGIDLVHNRFLILQGEVEQIAMMKPKGENAHEEGMLEYLEDIIGSSRFRVPIERLSARVDTLKEQRTNALQRVRVAEREKVALEGPVREMILYLKAENHAVLLRNQLFHIKLFKILEEIDELQPLRDEALEKKNAVDRALKEVLDAREADNDRLEAAQRDQAKICADEKAARDEISALERAAKARTNTMKRNVTDIARVGEEIEKEKQKLEELKGVPAKAAARLEVLKASIAELNELERDNIKKADDNRDKFDRKAGPEKAERARLEEEMGVLVLKEVDAKNKIHIAKETLKNMTHEETKLRKRLNDFQNNLTTWKEDLEKKTTEMDELKVSLPKVQEELAQARASLPVIKEKEDKLMEEVNALRAKVSEDKQLVSSGIAGTERQKALGKAKAEGLLKGLIGRLGDLGTIDKKYDAAISTTTAALDSYVVETTNDGHEAIDYLVKRNLGRTNFIILDKTNEFRDRMDTKQKFPAPRLFDLIDIPDPRLRKVFYSTVFDTLVVDTLKEATELSRKDRSLRIVTLLGQVIDSSGTVSGGGAPKYGLMGNKEKGQAEKSMRDAQSRLPAMIKELDEKNEKLAETSAACRQMEQKIFALSNDANRLRAQFNACDNEILKLTERIAHMEKQVVYKYLDEADTAKKRRQEIEEQAVKERVSIDLNEHNMEKVQNRIKFLEKQLADKKAKEQKLAEEEENLPKLLNQAKALQAELKMDALTLHQTQEFDVIPKETRRFNIDDPMDDSLFGDLTLADRPQEKKDKKRDKKKGGDEPEEFLESPDGTVPKLTREQVEGLDREHIKFTLTNIEQKQLSSRTDINMHVIHDYKTKV